MKMVTITHVRRCYIVIGIMIIKTAAHYARDVISIGSKITICTYQPTSLRPLIGLKGFKVFDHKEPHALQTWQITAS